MMKIVTETKVRNLVLKLLPYLFLVVIFLPFHVSINNRVLKGKFQRFCHAAAHFAFLLK